MIPYSDAHLTGPDLRVSESVAGLGTTYWIELDHIKPYKAGGYFIASNLRLLCQLCNIRKGSHWEGN